MSAQDVTTHDSACYCFSNSWLQQTTRIENHGDVTCLKKNTEIQIDNIYKLTSFKVICEFKRDLKVLIQVIQISNEKNVLDL